MAYKKPGTASVTLDAAQKPQIEALEAVIGRLGARDRDFAGDLIANFRRWGRLSDKQLVWVGTLTARATAPAPAPVAAVNVANIQAMFDRAGRTLKRIKVKLQTTEGQPLAFSRAGVHSKYAGQIMITDGGPFGDNKYFGRIDDAGNYHATARAGADVLALVREFAAEPETTAGRYGRLTGSCCFCNHTLKDSRSTELGYGPVCAQRFGLVH